MKIKEEYFEEGKEVDVRVVHKTDSFVILSTGYRVSIRKRNGKYELYKHYFTPHHRNFIVEEVIFSDKDLKKVVGCSNKLFDMNDEVK